MKTSKTGDGSGRTSTRTALRGLVILGTAAALSGCSWIGSRFSSDTPDTAKAPAATAPAAQSTLGIDPADPVPRDEPLNPNANKWYGANGRLYRPITDDRDFKERGKASVIGADQEGKPTANGDSFSPSAMTAAHPTLPIPSYARVTDLRTGKTAIVRVIDRGAYDRDEAIAISSAVARKIGLANNDEVEVERITPAQIAAMPPPGATAVAPAPAPAPPPPPVAVASPVQPAQAAAAPAETAALLPQPAEAAPAAAAPMAAPAPIAAAPVAPAAAARPAPAEVAPRAPARAPAAQSAPTGRWSVQVAAFATESMAESTRTRVAQQLAQNAPNLSVADRTPRVERHGNRSYVLLGDFADRDSAEALAGRLRAVLRQDVVVDRH
jgi:rare lipoprotein A